jgi:hypothetical protein
VLDPGPNLDAVALTTGTKLVGPQVESVTVGSQGTIFGSECEFLGFPYGSGWLGHWDSGQLARGSGIHRREERQESRQAGTQGNDGCR